MLWVVKKKKKISLTSIVDLCHYVPANQLLHVTTHIQL